MSEQNVVDVSITVPLQLSATTPQDNSSKRKADSQIDNDRANKKRKSNNIEKRKKYAFLFSYTGTNFSGVQIQPGDVVTIESCFLKALQSMKLINTLKANAIDLGRACRTDRGVHAIRNIVTISIMGSLLDQFGTIDEIVEKINTEMEKTKAQISGKNVVPPRRNVTLQSFQPVQTFFKPKDFCKRRTYLYLLPKRLLFGNQAINNLFQGSDNPSHPSNMSNEEIVTRLNQLLKYYEGRHSFHNFTTVESAEQPGHPSNYRHMFDVSVDSVTPVVTVNDHDYFMVRFDGQSFMLHQIRRMIGLIISVMLNLFPEEVISKALEIDYLCEVPQAPAVNLMLERMMFPYYDEERRQNLPPVGQWSPEVESKADAYRDIIFKEIPIADNETRETADFMFTLAYEFKKYCQFKDSGVKYVESNRSKKKREAAERWAQKQATENTTAVTVDTTSDTNAEEATTQLPPPADAQ
jgi:tRNA pseudouridine38-40 synthase